jgi:hypothetical protein
MALNFSSGIPVRLLAWLVLLVVLLTNGCMSSKPETKEEAEKRTAAKRAKSAEVIKSSLTKEERQISIPELDQLTYRYADRYSVAISSAVDVLKRGNLDPVQRRTAHQIKLQGILSMNDIVSGNDPYIQIFDLVVSVTLQSMVWIDEDRAEQVFGERASGLIKALRTMRVEAWQLADQVLTQEQLELLDYMILEWRRAHPQVEQVAYVKFDNFAGAYAADLLTGLKTGHGFLAPLSEASQTLKDWERLTERVFWYSKRAPNVAAIQAEGAVNEILSAPEINASLQTAERLAKTAESAPQLIDAQRRALFAELDARQTLLTNTLGDLRHIMADADSLGRTMALLATNSQQTLGALNDTLKVSDQVGRDLGFDKPSARPFDIQDWTENFRRLNEVITNVNLLCLSIEQLTHSEAWRKGLQDMTDAADRRVDRVFYRLCVLLGLAFLLAVAYRVISLKLTRRMAPPEKVEA